MEIIKLKIIVLNIFEKISVNLIILFDQFDSLS